MTTAIAVRGGTCPATIPGGQSRVSPHAAAGGWLLTILAALVLSLAVAVEGLRTASLRSIPSPPPVLDILPLFLDLTPVTVQTTVDWQKVPHRTTRDALRRDPAVWRRMHLEDWDLVPEGLRREGLDAMLARHASLLASPRAWDGMSAADWDAVPQPVRALAYRHMVEYWVGYYALGASHGLPRGLVADTAVAIVMNESWFEHRAVHENRHGNRDLGLGQASDFARHVMRGLHAAGALDVLLEDEDYFDPWKASRFVAVWLGLALDESGGDLALAVRAYHRGIGRARAGEGREYLDEVQRRLARYLRPESASPTWSHLRARDHVLTHAARPWMPGRDEVPAGGTPPRR